MKFKNIAIVKKVQKTISHSEYKDIHNNIHDNTWNREMTIYILGIPIYKGSRSLNVEEVILSKDGEPLGYSKPK